MRNVVMGVYRPATADRVWLLVDAEPQLDANGAVRQVVCTFSDITGRKQSEEALRRSEEALRGSHKQIRELVGRLVAAQEEERKRISRELHDDVNQQAAALAISLSKLKRQLPESDASLHNQITAIQDRIARIADRIRDLSHELHSATLQHAGLAAALRAHCAEFGGQTGIEVRLNLQDHLAPVSPDAALCLYRVAQESLRNVARHSGAEAAEVTLVDAAGGLELRIADDGAGFDLAQAQQKGGLGLVSMEERVKLLGGSLRVVTCPGAGTELRVYIPTRSEP